MKQIPEIEEPKIYEKHRFTSSEFVEVLSNEYFDVKMLYPVLGMDNGVGRCYMRKEAYTRLCEAAKKLPAGYRFRIWDAWRPFALQYELYEKYSVGIIQEFKLEKLPEQERRDFIKKFISEPTPDTKLPPVHTTGGAIDLTIIDASGNELDMGTGFDAFTDKTNTAYFETTGDETIRNNRRMLYWAMTEAGFTNLPSEWWHFDYGDRFWAYYNGKPARYEGVFTEAEINGERDER